VHNDKNAISIGDTKLGFKQKSFKIGLTYKLKEQVVEIVCRSG
jgi:hypothetical protein